jgi:hypothetical protein
MKKQKLLQVLSVTLVLFSAFSVLMVSLMALRNPQTVMDLVQVKLANNDAYSSIRGVYGGVGITIVSVLLYCGIKDVRKGLQFIALLWGCYAASRIITLWVEGPLGAFGKQWLTIEAILFSLAITLLFFYRRYPISIPAGKQVRQ